MEKDVNFTIILKFLYFKKSLVFKNTLKTPKMNFVIVVFGTPQSIKFEIPKELAILLDLNSLPKEYNILLKTLTKLGNTT